MLTSLICDRACYYNHEEAVKLMLKSSEHMPLANLSRGDTPLHCACNKDNIQLVEMLLDHSPRLALICDTIMDKRYSPLHIACKEKGNKKIVEIILQKIVVLLEGSDDYSEDSPLDMNIRDADGCTPLYYACYYGHDEIVSMLLKFGHQYKNCQLCDVSVTTLQQRTPLHAAVQRNHLSTLQIILDHCAQNKDCNIKELVNLLGCPSSNTKSQLLTSCSSARSSVVSISSIISQDIQMNNENTCDVFSAIPEEGEDEAQEQPFPKSLDSFKSKPSTKRSKHVTLPTRPTRNMTESAKSSPTLMSQQQVPLMRQRTRTDYSDSSIGLMSLFLTKDGSFLAHPAEHHLENIDKEFEQLLITPLAEACACGHSQAVDMLLSAGATDPEGMAVRLAQFAKNHELARSVLIRHCKLVVENPSQQPLKSLSIDWSDMRITELLGSWFVRGSNFFPSSAEDDEGNFLPMTSLPTQLNAYRLTKVSLSRNNLTSLPVELLQLPNLQFLDVSSNLIQNIHSKISCPALTCLYLSNNKLIELPIAIWYLPLLAELDIKNNLLESITKKKSIDSVRLSNSLRVVDISHNKFDDLPSFILELPALVELNVSHNELKTLPHNLWKCSTLTELNASHNVISSLPSCEPQSTLMSSQQPHTIPAVQCGRKVVGAKALVQGNFDKLRSKPFKRNTMRFFSALDTPQEVYTEEYIYQNEGCCKVEKMLLNGNKLSIFPDALPCLVPLLIELDISHNNIEEIDISFLPLMLRKLVASNNKIKRFGTFVDAQLKNHMIRYCRMVDNQHQQCHHRTHKEMKNLTTINLASNQLTHFQLMKSLEVDKRSPSKQTDNVAADQPSENYSQLDLLYPELENLNISNNRLEGCFNHNIGYQSQLKSVTLGGNVELEELPMEFAYFKKSKKFTQLALYNLPKLRDPPVEYHKNKLRTLLSYMSSRLKK